MSDVATLVTRAHAYARESGLAVSTVSRKLLGNGKRLGELEAGKSLRVDVLERANSLLDKFEQNGGPPQDRAA